MLDAVRKKKTPEDVARQIELKLPKALSKALKEFAECGVPFEEYMQSRDDAQQLKRLVRKCEGHEFANLFQQTAAISQGEDDVQLVRSYLNGILDRVTDQVVHRVAGAEWESVNDVREMISEAREVAKPDIERIADKLAGNPNWNPTVKKRSQEEKQEDTASLLKASLIGGKKK